MRDDQRDFVVKYIKLCRLYGHYVAADCGDEYDYRIESIQSEDWETQLLDIEIWM